MIPKWLPFNYFYSTIIDPLQKWLPLNYSFVHIQNNLTNLIFWDNNSKEFVIVNEASEALLNMNKRKI